MLKPYGVAIHDGKIYLVDTVGTGIGVFDLVKKEFRIERGSGNGSFGKPINIAFDAAGNRFVADAKRMQILMFDSLGTYVRSYGVSEQFKPTDVAVVGMWQKYKDQVGQNAKWVCEILGEKAES